ncbi:diacylglycerol/lipid kinase family protein [Patulibacter minatonensis]|uniref:diacylglycerol/lipid kinase family protein n=1 Tax=Patulibacter minatonensis TaxID=298163 RepID=UPI00146F9568|nr:diacylglycerol kinase family protein [Patulibacter minatonensis]
MLLRFVNVSAPAPDASALTSSRRRRLAVIVNPNATTTSPRLRSLVVHALSHRFDVEPVDTEGPRHATELARIAAENGADAVVTLGGDGTVNEAANGLVGTGVPLVPLPGGATNVFHRLIGMPGDIVDATEHVLSLADRWDPRPVDVGRIGDRWFTFAAGVGLDASVVHRVDQRPKLKARFGPWFYTAAAVGTFNRTYVRHPPQMVLELPDGRELPGVTAIFQNAPEFTYFASRPVRLLHGQSLHTGNLSGAVLRHSRPTVMPGVTLRALVPSLDLGRHRAVEAVHPLTQAVVRSTDDRALPFQVDGDYVGETDRAEIAVQAGGLLVVA